MRRFSCFGVSVAMRRCFPYILRRILHVMLAYMGRFSIFGVSAVMCRLSSVGVSAEMCRINLRHYYSFEDMRTFSFLEFCGNLQICKHWSFCSNPELIHAYVYVQLFMFWSFCCYVQIFKCWSFCG